MVSILCVTREQVNSGQVHENMHIIVAPRLPFAASSKELASRIQFEVNRAIELQQKGNLTAAVNIYRRIIALIPNHYDSWIMRVTSSDDDSENERIHQGQEQRLNNRP